jgi:hypothetical protein
MFIRVTDETREEIFKGDAEDFLSINDYDEEMCEILNRLDNYKVSSKAKIYGNFGDIFVAEKIDETEVEE